MGRGGRGKGPATPVAAPAGKRAYTEWTPEVRHKVSRAAFERASTPRKRSPPTPVSPARKRCGTKSAWNRGAKRTATVLAILAAVNGGATVNAAIKQACAESPLVPQPRQRDARKWWAKSIDGSDTRELAKNASGQGRKSAWTDKSKQALRKYLLTTPHGGSKAKKGRGDWPSCGRLARDPDLQRKIGVPAQTVRQYANVAQGMGMAYGHRGHTVMLTKGMRKRRVAMAKKYLKKPKQWWDGVAVQDEGGQDQWIAGPWKAWHVPDDESTKKPIREVKGGSDKLNFSVLGAVRARAPLFTYKGTLKAEGFKEISLKQIKPFFRANPHLHSIILDGDKTHPGQGTRASLEVNELWRTDPVLKKIHILRGPDKWDADGELHPAADQAHRLSLARHKMPAAAEVETWAANSPDLNPAEHEVADVKMPYNWVEGSYTYAELEKTAREMYDDRGVDCLTRSIRSMPQRLEAVIRKDGFALEHDDYKTYDA